MWRNYLTVGIRALTKNRTYALINILGLAIGLAACLLILLYVREQVSFDRFVPDHDRIYQLQAAHTDTETGMVNPIQPSPYAAGQALKKDFPQIEAQTYLANSQPIIMDKGEPRRLTISRVSRDFFKVFDLPFVQGNAATALPDVNALAMSQRTAKALFGTEDAVGKTVSVVVGDATRDMRVTAVFKDLPRTSHNQIGMVALVDETLMAPDELTQWGWYSGYNYVKLRPGTDVAAINAQLGAWKLRNAPRDTIGGRLVSQAEDTDFTLLNLADIHLGKAQGGPAGNEQDRSTVVTFGVLAVLILVMACVNFTNLATARASQRAREVALRKVLGASRKQLIAQFLCESVLVTGIAMLLALAVVELALPWLRQLLRADLTLRYFGSQGVLLPAIGLSLLVGLAGGLYPAFYLTRFQPARVLKANKSAAEAEGSGSLRNVLVVVQFAISIGLIVCTAVVYLQTDYVRNTDPGFKRTGLLQIENAARKQVASNAEAIERELARVPGVRSVARTEIAMATNTVSNNSVMLPGRPTPLTLGTYNVGWGYFDTMGIKLVAGRYLSRSFAMDDATTSAVHDLARERALVARGMNVVVNESSARQMGFRSPQEAVGKQIQAGFVSSELGMVPATIVGVVRDTRFRSARQEVEDAIYFHDDDQLGYFVVRIEDADPAKVAREIEAAWRRVVPNVPFEAEFSEAAAARLYASDEAVGRAFAGFALLSVLIACLGLFGLAAFTAERRTKEIGIRKVLGARTRDIVQLLVWQFSKPVLIANLVAWPFAWWAMRNWLNQFQAQMPLGPAPFIAAGLLAIVIAIATIGSHAFRVAGTNPVHALRYE
ncbi:ABC transporter permease [Sphingomonas sp. S2-65]|uniref:ABC transporter permease n=1 Tax=Sphingomonas sp. S2-65 TaxID=2903960 RepID=UPI001F1C6653|nr:ABC transporter permease [Sphingomonas sp. S2-65]UYY57873.1 ABC transporter permease [Sphingomonas sp. S2-65]